MGIDTGETKQAAVSVSPIAAQMDRQWKLIEALIERARELEERLLVVSQVVHAPQTSASAKQEQEKCSLSETGQRIDRVNHLLDLLREMINSMIVRLEI